MLVGGSPDSKRSRKLPWLFTPALHPDVATARRMLLQVQTAC